MINLSTRLINESEYQRLRSIEDKARAYFAVLDDEDMPDTEWERLLVIERNALRQAVALKS